MQTNKINDIEKFIYRISNALLPLSDKFQDAYAGGNADNIFKATADMHENIKTKAPLDPGLAVFQLCQFMRGALNSKIEVNFGGGK